MTMVAMAVFEKQVKTLEADIAKVMGVINAAHGRLVQLMGEALAEDLWKVWGIHSPSHFLGWQAGMTPARAGGIAKIAARRDELPCAVAALVAGELSVDAVIEIATSAPAKYEESITFFAKSATINQLRRCLKDYDYDDPDVDDAKAKPREDERSVSMGSDTKSWWFKGRLPLDEGAIVEQAIKTARDDAYRQARALLPDGANAPTVTWADGLLSVAEASLRAGESAFPGSDRYLVHLHLNVTPTEDDPTGMLSLHLGPPIPAALRSLLTCDGNLRPIYEVHGRPISVGRLTRVISRRLRRLVEHRDGGCRAPGCDRTTGLEIHHICHWEHGGPTDTSNLVTLCRAHHRTHHTGLLGIDLVPQHAPHASSVETGPAGHDGTPTADRANEPVGADHPDGLRFADRWGHTLDPTGTPNAPSPAHRGRPTEAAADLGIHPGQYEHPLGERLNPWGVTFNPNTLPASTAPPGGSGPSDRPDRPDPPARVGPSCRSGPTDRERRRDRTGERHRTGPPDRAGP